MKKELNINGIVSFLAGTAIKSTVLNDTIWRYYGFKRKPRYGSIWSKLFPKKFKLIQFIERELLIMGIIDLLSAIKNSEETKEHKILLSIGVIENFIEISNGFFPANTFCKSLIDSYLKFMQKQKDKIFEPFNKKAYKNLNKKDFSRFLLGTTKIISYNKLSGYFFINPSYVNEIIEKTNYNEKLKISIPNHLLDVCISFVKCEIYK